MDIFNELDADFFCLQETKLQEGQIDLELPGYYDYWNYAEKKAIQEQPFLPNINQRLFTTESENKNTMMKDE